MNDKYLPRSYGSHRSSFAGTIRRPKRRPKRLQVAPKRKPREYQDALKTIIGSTTYIVQNSLFSISNIKVFEGRKAHAHKHTHKHTHTNTSLCFNSGEPNVHESECVQKKQRTARSKSQAGHLANVGDYSLCELR